MKRKKQRETMGLRLKKSSGDVRDAEASRGGLVVADYTVDSDRAKSVDQLGGVTRERCGGGFRIIRK